MVVMYMIPTLVILIRIIRGSTLDINTLPKSTTTKNNLFTALTYNRLVKDKCFTFFCSRLVSRLQTVVSTSLLGYRTGRSFVEKGAFSWLGSWIWGRRHESQHTVPRHFPPKKRKKRGGKVKGQSIITTFGQS